MTREVKFEYNINGAIEEIVGHGTLTQPPFEKLDLQPVKLSRGELIDIKEETPAKRKYLPLEELSAQYLRDISQH